jgi:hypothetical protein
MKARKQVPTPEQIYRNFLKQPPQVSKGELALLNSRLTEFTPWLRLSLATLAKSGNELCAIARRGDSEVQATADLYVAAEDFAERFKELSGLLTTVSTRLALSLAERPDMMTLMAEAKARMLDSLPPGVGHA